MDLKRLVVESENGSGSIAKDLFVALLGSEDLVLDGEFDSEVKLLKEQKDLEEVVSTLKREKDYNETFVGAILTANRTLLISYIENEEHPNSQGYMGEAYYEGKDGIWYCNEAYAWVKSYDVEDELPVILGNVFGLSKKP